MSSQGQSVETRLWSFPKQRSSNMTTRIQPADLHPTAEVSPDAIMQLGFGYWGSRTLLSAVELGLFTELAKGPMTLDEIRNRLNLHERSARDFLDALVALDMLMRDSGGRYSNTAATDLYLDRN